MFKTAIGDNRLANDQMKLKVSFKTGTIVFVTSFSACLWLQSNFFGSFSCTVHISIFDVKIFFIYFRIPKCWTSQIILCSCVQCRHDVGTYRSRPGFDSSWKHMVGITSLRAWLRAIYSASAVDSVISVCSLLGQGTGGCRKFKEIPLTLRI